MLKKITTSLVIMSILVLVGCAGRTANPINVVQPGDNERNCAAIKQELTFIESEIKRLIPESEKTGDNVALGVVGLFLIVPWFFMDFSEAEKIEINAFRQRYNYLAILYNDKECGNEIQSIPDFKTSTGSKEDAAK